MLREVSRLFREEPDKIGQNRDALMERLASQARPAGKVTIGARELDQLARQIGGAFDPVHGGLRGAPKFPNAALYELLWRAGLRSGDERFFELIEHTLERICEGGIYDHLGGGFSRYSVDERWLVPHFEKMLYDNAQLLGAAGAGVCAHRQSAVPPARGRNGRLARPRDDHRRRGRFPPRSTPIRRARRASSTSGRRPRSSRRWARKMLRFLCSITT